MIYYPFPLSSILGVRRSAFPFSSRLTTRPRPPPLTIESTKTRGTLLSFTSSPSRDPFTARKKTTGQSKRRRKANGLARAAERARKGNEKERENNMAVNFRCRWKKARVTWRRRRLKTPLGDERRCLYGFKLKKKGGKLPRPIRRLHYGEERSLK